MVQSNHQKKLVKSCTLTITRHLPNIFVSTVGDEVEGGEVAVHCQQVQTQQHHQDLDDDPHEGSAGIHSKDLWTEPSHTDDTHVFLFDTNTTTLSHKTLGGTNLF